MILGGNFIFSLSFIFVGFVLCHILGPCRLSPVAPAEPRGLLALGGPQAWHLVVPTGLDVGSGTSGVPPAPHPLLAAGRGPVGWPAWFPLTPRPCGARVTLDLSPVGTL